MQKGINLLYVVYPITNGNYGQRVTLLSLLITATIVCTPIHQFWLALDFVVFGRVQVEADGRGVVDDRHRHNVLERQHRVDRVEHQQQQLKQKQKFLHFRKYIIGAELVHVTKSILGFCEGTKSMEKRCQEKKIQKAKNHCLKTLARSKILCRGLLGLLSTVPKWPSWCVFTSCIFERTSLPLFGNNRQTSHYEILLSPRRVAQITVPDFLTSPN